MSDTGNNSARIPGEPTAARSGRNPPKSGCVTALLILAGVVLLLPGLCTLFFSGSNGGVFSPPLFYTITKNAIRRRLAANFVVFAAKPPQTPLRLFSKFSKTPQNIQKPWGF